MCFPVEKGFGVQVDPEAPDKFNGVFGPFFSAPGADPEVDVGMLGQGLLARQLEKELVERLVEA